MDNRKINMVGVGIFYAVLLLVSVVWHRFRGLIYIPSVESFTWRMGLFHALSALLPALAAIWASSYMVKRSARIRRVALEFKSFLYPLSFHDVVLLAIFSALGEEFFFRGVLQGEIGIVGASLIFGLLHVGPKRDYLLWTGFAVILGFILGGIYILTHDIFVPVLAHFLINAVNLRFLGKLKEESWENKT